MPVPSTGPTSLFMRVSRWLGLDDSEDQMPECPCAVAARMARAADEARASKAAEKLAKQAIRQAKRAAAGGAVAAGQSANAVCPLASQQGSARVTPAGISTTGEAKATSRKASPDGRLDLAATYAMGGFFHSGFLADTFVYLPDVWLGSDGEY